MTDRDRLIEIIYCAGRDYDDYVDNQHEMGMSAHEDFDSWLADELIARGVILPPFKLGQKVYDISEFMSGTYAPEMYVLQDNELYIEKNKAGEYIFTYDGMYVYPEDMGRSLFLTKEEAEQALKEREKV